MALTAMRAPLPAPSSAQAGGQRLASLDACRGFVVLAMIWVNYLAGMPGIPYWLEHASPHADGVNLPDLVFPAFLFMAGMAIPLALRRDAAGGLTAPLLGRLLWRAGSLMVAGVVLAEAWRYDAAAALLPRALYFTLFYAAMVLLWRQPAAGGPARGWLFWLGAALMAALLALFRGKTGDGATSAYLQHSWWGILGMIGWAYLVCGVLYLAVRGRDAALWGGGLLLLALYVGGTDGWLPVPRVLNGFVNVPQVLGSTSVNMLAGVLAGRILLAQSPGAPARAVWPLAALALVLLAAGLLLRPFYGINKIHATAPYSLVCAGITLALFVLLYWLCDVRGWRRWCAWLIPAGGNALLAYIAPDVWEQLAALLHLPRFWWPLWQQGGAAGVLNAAVLALGMIGLTGMATRAGLKLKM
jgi:predicted acyltransferase